MDKRWRNLSVIIIIIIAIAVLLFVPIELPNDVSNGVPSQTVALESVAQKYNFSLDTLTFADNTFDSEILVSFKTDLLSVPESDLKELVSEKIAIMQELLTFFDKYYLMVDVMENTDAPCNDVSLVSDVKSEADLLMQRIVSFNDTLTSSYMDSDYVGFSLNETGIALSVTEEYQNLLGGECA